jgi:hypothetical protein
VCRACDKRGAEIRPRQRRWLRYRWTAPARRLADFANATEAVPDGRIYIELINPFSEGRRAARSIPRHACRAFEKRWFERHESDAYVRVTQAGANLFA